jgi:hypothetical protein
MPECFLKLKVKLSKDNPIYTEYKNLDYRHADVAKWQGREAGSQDTSPNNTFKRASVPMDFFKDEPILDIMKEYDLVPKIFFMDPEHVYNWHRDVYRYAPLNLLVHGNDDYLVMFSHEYPNGKYPFVTYRDYEYFPYKRLVYEPNSFYLFNSQIPHAVINHGSEPRYLLTLSKFSNGPIESTVKGIPDFDYFIETQKTLKEKGYL